jgi:TM2 domain-containing membrane protein YozV
MGWRIRRSVNLGGGFRLNLSKSGLGLSAGVRGARVSFGPRGARYSVGIPGTGIYWTQSLGQRTRRRRSRPAEIETPRQRLDRYLAQMTPAEREKIRTDALQMKPKSPVLAALLSLVLPGAGQAYLGLWGRAILYVLTFWTIVGWVLAVVNAYRTAQKSNAGLIVLQEWARE